MNQLVVTIVGGLAVVIIGNLFGFSGSRKVVVEGNTKVRKTGKWMVLISILMILGGLLWAGNNHSNTGLLAPGYVVALYGLFFYPIGKFIAWFQSN